jgi:splicing factor 1
MVDYDCPYDYSGHIRYFNNEEPRGRSKRKRTRWGSEAIIQLSSSLSQIPKYIPGGLTTEQQEALMVRIRIDEITRKIIMSDLDLNNPYIERSPSPEPIYDNQGKRVNTREQRAKDKLNSERTRLVERATAMNPNFKPPADYIPTTTKKMKKIMIPIDKYPDYNFIGLIIGPRGNTQKKMEKESNCKIAIRGKGSTKEGKIKAGKINLAEDEPLHVLITGDSEASVEKAAKMINELLIPVEEGKNEHKKQQLLELAKINGTLREFAWMAPSEQSFERPKIRCDICGDQSHPTSDCILRGTIVPPVQKQQIDQEFEKFLEEIGDESSKSKEQNTGDIYQDYYSSIDPNQQLQQPWVTGMDANVPPWLQPPTMGMTPAPWGVTPWSVPPPIPPMSYPPNWQQPQQ